MLLINSTELFCQPTVSNTAVELIHSVKIIQIESMSYQI